MDRHATEILESEELLHLSDDALIKVQLLWPGLLINPLLSLFRETRSALLNLLFSAPLLLGASTTMLPDPTLNRFSSVFDCR